jgi:uncharacterized protein (DUF427 family)
MTTTTRGRIKIERSAKRVRGYLGGQPVVDSAQPVLVWEKLYYPTYYFPVTDVQAELVPDGTAHSPSRGEAVTYTVVSGDHRAKTAALRYPDSPIEELRDLVRFEWDAIDAWFEEDEEVFVHPRDPNTRIDILASSKHVRIEVDGVTVAESTSPRLLFETGLPVRYYLPKTHVRMDLLEHTDTVTHCPYKGAAEYWAVRAGDSLHTDLAWSYRAPVPESQKVMGLISFYDEKVDIFVDGVLQERPKSPFG